MLDDFTPIIHTLPGRTIKVWAIADVHIGAKEANLSGFSSFLRRIEQDADSYIVLVGDLLNNGLKDSLTNVYEETMPPHAQVEKAVELLTPVAGKILGCVGGNHELRTKRGVDVDIMAQVMTLLGKPELYRPNMAFIRVRLKNGKKSTSDSYSLLLVHGKTENKKRRLAYAVEGVDAIISGHTHNGIVEKPARLVFNERNRVTIKPLVSLTACSWLSYGGYTARGLMLPSATSSPQCLVLEYVNSNDIRGNIHVSW